MNEFLTGLSAGQPLLWALFVLGVMAVVAVSLSIFWGGVFRTLGLLRGRRGRADGTMYFPNADVVIHPALLVFLGMIVGMLGGFFGVGGGFSSPRAAGVRGAAGLRRGHRADAGDGDLDHQHPEAPQPGQRRFQAGRPDGDRHHPGHIPGGVGERVVEAAGIAGPVIRYIYVGFLASLGLFILYDFWRTWLRQGRHSGGGEDITTAGLTQRVRSLRIPPHRVGIPGVGGVSTYVALPVSGIERISVFVPVLIGFGIGFIAGLLGRVAGSY